MKIKKDIFRAYDIRGKYPNEINEKIVSEIIKAFSVKRLAFSQQITKRRRNLLSKIVVARDCRRSSPVLYNAVINTLNKTLTPKRYTLYAIGIATTPMLSFLVHHLKADGGIMITASHNPKEYNGIKMVGKNAEPIGGREIYKLVK